jgi:2-hydroxychromene-2-carboxylate isomerase
VADLEFFWDPGCPWAWITSRWVVNVQAEKPLAVDWRFIALRFVNAHRNYEAEFPAGYERRHDRGLSLLRVAAAVRRKMGGDAVGPLYTAFGRRIHVERAAESLEEPGGIEAVLDALGYPPALAVAARSTDHDDLIRSETDEALRRCGGNIGTPVLSFDPPDGPSFFGPVLSRAPRGHEALELWDAVTTLGANPFFSELKRSTRGRPQFEE